LVSVLHPSPRPSPTLSGRKLLDIAVRASLESARARQYDSFLGNPDPSGSSASTFSYVSGTRPGPVVSALPRKSGRDTVGVVFWVCGGLAAFAAAALAWSRA
jgi:hypothetical protein